MRIGIDLGDTKTEIIVLGDDGAECWRQRVPTPRDDYAGTIAAIAALVAEAEGKAGVPQGFPPVTGGAAATPVAPALRTGKHR